MNGGLDNGILFSMQTTAQLMTLTGWNTHLLPEAPHIKTMIYSGRGSVVPGGYDALVPH
jgi:hypothetical protein